MNTRIFLDSGNPVETRHALSALGFLHGQTTNPSLVAKSPHIQELKQTGVLNDTTIWDKYREVALQIREILPTGDISVEVFADATTTYEDMLSKAHELASWFPGIFVKLPITETGLRVAQQLVSEDINVNMTLCFSQEQAAAVHAATRGARKGQVFVSPFIGRLDDIGQQGSHLIRNILMMYRQWDSHVMVLGASIRSLAHLFECLKADIDIVTIPVSVVDMWATFGVETDIGNYVIEISGLQPIAFIDLPNQDWMLYDIHHGLTDQGIEKFAGDWKSLFE